MVSMQPETLEGARARLDRLWARGTAFLGCRYAILGGAMTWVSEKNLVAAISNAGGFRGDCVRGDESRRSWRSRSRELRG